MYKHLWYAVCETNTYNNTIVCCKHMVNKMFDKLLSMRFVSVLYHTAFNISIDYYYGRL